MRPLNGTLAGTDSAEREAVAPGSAFDVSFGLADLVLIPGLGADERQFEPQRAVFPGLRVPRWIEPREGESLKLYSVRLGDEMRVTAETVVGGSSFGGMVALEMAHAFRCRAVVLIGSCREPEGVSPLLRAAEWFNPVIPEWLVAAVIPLGSTVLPLIDPVPRVQARLLAAMVRETGPAFMKWGARSLFEWQGRKDPGVPVHHIHGSRDRIMPVSRVRPDVVVEGHGHFLNMTAPVDVNGFLSRVVLGG